MIPNGRFHRGAPQALEGESRGRDLPRFLWKSHLKKGLSPPRSLSTLITRTSSITGRLEMAPIQPLPGPIRVPGRGGRGNIVPS